MIAHRYVLTTTPVVRHTRAMRTSEYLTRTAHQVPADPRAGTDYDRSVARDIRSHELLADMRDAGWRTGATRRNGNRAIVELSRGNRRAWFVIDTDTDRVTEASRAVRSIIDGMFRNHL